MTEESWLAHTYPPSMVQFIEQRTSGRKLRLFACACARWTWDTTPDERYLVAVETAERFADGLATAEELAGAYRSARRLSLDWAREHPNDPRLYNLIAPADAASPTPTDAAFTGALDAGWGMGNVDSPQYAMLAVFVREVFGNPFRTVTFDSVWRTAAVMLLAQGVYDERAFDRMPILADALQDAGCDSDAILNHLRDPHATHVRGCWALDLVLGKE